MVPTFDFLFCSSQRIIAPSRIGSGEKTARKPRRMPILWSRLRSMWASGQWWVFEMSAISSFVGSVLAPAPIELTSGSPRSNAAAISASLGERVSMASTT